MSDPIYARVRQNPKFQELIRRRGRLAALLSAVVLVGYYGFIMIVAFAPGILGAPLSDGMVLSVGVPVGAILVLVGWLTTGVYSYFANGAFEDLNAEIVRESQR